MSRFLELPSRAWDARVTTLLGTSPYVSARWGNMVAAAFGGDFRGLVIGSEPGYLVPVLVGGDLAYPGFVCGHLGYGGVFSEHSDGALDLLEQLTAIMDAENHLKLPCNRFVTSPHLREPAQDEQLTMMLSLPNDAQALWTAYPRKTRNVIRRSTQSGLTVANVAPQHAADALALIHATQVRVRAAYLTPSSLFASLLDAPDFAMVKGCFIEDRLVAVGVFLHLGATAAYFLNGWDDFSRATSPNYMMLHAAFTELAQRGIERVDLGFSHSLNLLSNKRRWGARAAAFRRITDLSDARAIARQRASSSVITN